MEPAEKREPLPVVPQARQIDSRARRAGGRKRAQADSRVPRAEGPRRAGQPTRAASQAPLIGAPKPEPVRIALQAVPQASRELARNGLQPAEARHRKPAPSHI